MIMTGSPEVERLGLNNVFEFDITIQLKVKPASINPKAGGAARGICCPLRL